MKVEERLLTPTGPVSSALVSLLRDADLLGRDCVALFLSAADAKSLAGELRLSSVAGLNFRGVPVAVMSSDRASFLYSEPKGSLSCLTLEPL